MYFKFVKFCFLQKCCLKLSVRHSSWKTLFFGSDEFSVYSLHQLQQLLHHKKKLTKLDVVTTIGAKSNPVKRFADENQLPVISWPPQQVENYDIGVVVSFGHLIPRRIIESFPLGMINVHASLLPRWRGASPIIHSIMNGDTETGVTIMRINPHHFDTGNIIIQNSCPIGKDELMPSLHKKLGILGSELLVESVCTLPDCISNSQVQSQDSVTYAPRIHPDIADVRWDALTCIDIYNRYRALYSIYELKTHWHGVKVKLKKLVIFDRPSESRKPGTILWDKDLKQVKVACKNGFVVVELMNVGGKSLRGIDFYNGYLSKRKEKQWYFSNN